MLTLYRLAVIKRSAYSLVELLVVLGIITLLAVIGVPNLFGNNERYALDHTAKKLEQLLIDARTRSIAPADNAGGGYTQIFQVTFGDFPDGSVSSGDRTALGNINTNTASLESGLASCGTGVAQGSVTTHKSLIFPQNIYLSSFFPTNQTSDKATIRFSVGQVGFQCGDTASPIDSTDLTAPYWSGSIGGKDSNARYLVLELSSTNKKRYIAIDRLSSEIVVSQTNPQAGFTAPVDTSPPDWPTAPAPRLSIVCRTEVSELLLTFPRAIDRWRDDDVAVDPNRLVFYDIQWRQGATPAGQNQPLATKYFSPLIQNTVSFRFSTRAITTVNQPTPIVFRVWAFDTFGNRTDYRDFTFARPTDWNCGNVVSDGNCISRLPQRPLIFRPVMSYSEGFEIFGLTDNPCVSDINDGSGAGSQGEMRIQEAPIEVR